MKPKSKTSHEYRLKFSVDNKVEENDFIEWNLNLEDKESLIKMPRHPKNENVNAILSRSELLLEKIHEQQSSVVKNQHPILEETYGSRDPVLIDEVHANSYVDLGRIDTVGFDYDYTLVTYTPALQELIYNMSLRRLVESKQYPYEMLGHASMKFDPTFSIRGLAVDRENGWICHLSYTHKVAVAWNGRGKVSREELMGEYSGKRSLSPSIRKKRLKPLNDLFSMAECCLIADCVEFLKNSGIPFCRRSLVNDVLSVIGETHISGDFHRMVADMPSKYFEPQVHLKEVLQKLKNSGKRLIFVSNSPFWYVDAGMTFFFGKNWRDSWDAVIVSAGKPNFYTEDARPFREVSSRTGRVKFKKVDRLEPGEVYTEGCLRELTKCLDWTHASPYDYGDQSESSGGGFLSSPNILYIGDSLFADLVDAKREFGWTTAAVAPEVGYESDLQSRSAYISSQDTIDLLLHTLRLVQAELGTSMRSPEDLDVLNSIEKLVSKWRDEQIDLMGNPFGSIFRARYQPSLFAHSLRRYCDLYMSNVGCLRHYSPQHRFYPFNANLLSHESKDNFMECYRFDNLLG